MNPSDEEFVVNNRSDGARVFSTVSKVRNLAMRPASSRPIVLRSVVLGAIGILGLTLGKPAATQPAAQHNERGAHALNVELETAMPVVTRAIPSRPGLDPNIEEAAPPVLRETERAAPALGVAPATN